MSGALHVPFQVVTHEVSGVPVLRVRGELCYAAAPSLEDAVERVAQRSWLGAETRPVLVVDLAGVSFMDSEGLKAIFACVKRLGERGVEVRVVARGSVRARRIFEVIDRLPLYPSLGAAVETGLDGAGQRGP